MTSASGPQSIANYFKQLYDASQDPYELKKRWYEERKKRLILASLPQRTYRRGYEPGCGIGDMSACLAKRCACLIASDANAQALTHARERLATCSNVELLQQSLPDDWPDEAGEFDLIVLSEILYFMNAEQLAATIRLSCKAISREGTLAVCNWKPAFKERQLPTSYISARFNEIAGITRLVVHDEEDFLLELFSYTPDSVARKEGFV